MQSDERSMELVETRKKYSGEEGLEAAAIPE
jgi:hypothetical protein